MSIVHLLAALAVARVCGLVAQRLDLPGGLILGAMVGAAAVTLTTGASITLPAPLEDAAFIIIGAAIGVQLTRQVVARLATVAVPAVMSGVLIIVAGLAIAYLLRALGMSPPGDVLATSPGALSVMSALAVERDTGAAEVAVFHLVRIVMVILSLPVLVHLLRDGQ
jgi:membrane AbrB-like protein